MFPTKAWHCSDCVIFRESARDRQEGRGQMSRELEARRREEREIEERRLERERMRQDTREGAWGQKIGEGRDALASCGADGSYHKEFHAAASASQHYSIKVISEKLFLRCIKFLNYLVLDLSVFTFPVKGQMATLLWSWRWRAPSSWSGVRHSVQKSI